MYFKRRANTQFINLAPEIPHSTRIFGLLYLFLLRNNAPKCENVSFTAGYPIRQLKEPIPIIIGVSVC
ncbi:unnamed protein product [Blepharisma stoltei]|uniref:Uncharacterized protein n=1 Tax=Blepharisma stoltei TaxID=1481888 RepID=A0AAU9IGX5_9CILI|nr:unnamed protein product [Blepharisma stoltei]